MHIDADMAFFGTAISGGNLTGFSPQVGSLEILETTHSTILLQAKVNITNPTEYSATVPYVNIQMLNNGSVLGNATAENVSVVPGPNNDIVVKALWKPEGKKGVKVGRELLSQYVSGILTPHSTKHPLLKPTRLQHNHHPPHHRRQHPIPATTRPGPLQPLNRNANPKTNTTQEPQPAHRRPNRRPRRRRTAFHRRRYIPPPHLNRHSNASIASAPYRALYHID